MYANTVSLSGCRTTHNTQTCRSLDTSTDKKNTEGTQTQNLPVLHQREVYPGAASKQKVTVTPQKGNADSYRHALLQTVSVCRHVQNTQLVEQCVHLDVLPLRLKSTNNSSPDSNGSRLNSTAHADLINFQVDCFTFPRPRNVKELPAVLPRRFRFRSLSSISHIESQEEICFASGSFHTSTAHEADDVKINNRFMYSFKDPPCARNPGTTSATTSGTTSGTTSATTPGTTTAGIYDPTDARTSCLTSAGTLDPKAIRNPDPAAGIHPTIDQNTRMQKLTVEGINIRQSASHKRTCIEKTCQINDNSWKEMPGGGSHLAKPYNWNVPELKLNQPSNWASLNSTATKQAAYFRKSDTFQQPCPVAPDKREIAATQGLQNVVGKERTDEAKFSWGYVVKEKLLLPSAIRQGLNPFQTESVVAPELDTTLVPTRLEENSTTDVGTYLSSLEDTVEPRHSIRRFSEESTAVASCHADMWIDVNIRSLDVDRSQQGPIHLVDEGSSLGDLESGHISQGQASQHENFRDYITWSGSDVSDTLSIVTEVPEPCLHEDHFHNALQLDSDETFEESTFDDSTVDCTLDESIGDDDLSEYNSHDFKSTGVTGESSVGASDGNTHSTSHIHWKNTGSQVWRMQHHLPIGSQQNIQQSSYSSQYLPGNVGKDLDYEDLTDARHMFQHLDKGIDSAHRTSTSQGLSREHQLKVSEPLVNWSVHEEEIKSDNVTHDLDKKINKSDHNSSMYSPGKSTPGGKPTLLSLANKGKQQDKSQLPQSTSLKGVAAATVNRTAPHRQNPHQAREDSRATLVLHDSSSGRQAQGSGICVLLLTVLAPMLIFTFI